MDNALQKAHHSESENETQQIKHTSHELHETITSKFIPIMHKLVNILGISDQLVRCSDDCSRPCLHSPISEITNQDITDLYLKKYQATEEANADMLLMSTPQKSNIPKPTDPLNTEINTEFIETDPDINSANLTEDFVTEEFVAELLPINSY